MAGAIGGINKQYVSSTSFLDQREILNKVLDITNEEASFLDVMELTGRSNPTSVPTYHHFVNDELYVLATASAVGTDGVSQTVTIDATAYAFVNAGELALLPSGKVAYVVSKNGSNQLTLKNVNAAQNVSAGASDKISFISNTNGEGSLSPAAKRWGITKFENQVQIFKGKFEVTDIAKASKVEVEFQGKPFYMYKGQHESLMKFRSDISAGMFFGRRSVDSSGNLSGFSSSSPHLTDAEGKAVQTTGGLDEYIVSYGGYNQNLATGGTVVLADIQTLTQELNKLRAPQEYFLFVGTSMNIAFDNLFNNLGNSALLSQGARFQIAGKSLDLGIDTVKIYGRTYHKKYMPLLDHKNIVNFTGGYNAKDAAYGAPATKQKTTDGQMLDRIQVRYMAGDGTDLKYREILLGGLAPVPTNERSVLEVHYESVQGLQVLGTNHFFKLK